MFGPPKKQNVDPDPTAAIAGICALLGLGLSFLGTKNAVAPAIAGAVGALSLFLMKVRLDDQVLKQGNGMLLVSYETGYVLVMVLLIAGAAWNVFLIAQRKKLALSPSPSPPERQSVTVKTAACPFCGTETSESARFCRSCGRPMTALTNTPKI